MDIESPTDDENDDRKYVHQSMIAERLQSDTREKHGTKENTAKNKTHSTRPIFLLIFFTKTLQKVRIRKVDRRTEADSEDSSYDG